MNISKDFFAKNIIVVYGSLLAVLVLSFTLCGCDKADGSNSNVVPNATRAPVKVKVLVVKNSSIPSERAYSGTIEEERSTLVSFASVGTIKELYLTEGKRVQKGALIGSLDETSAKSALEIAQAMKAQAEDARSRMEKLHENKSISEIQWMDIESKYKQAVASEKMAQKALDDCKLVSPATGIVAKRMAEVGQNVVPGSPVLKIVEISRVKAKVFVPESEISSIKVGDKVEVMVAALGGKIFTGKVSERGVQANPMSRSYEVFVTLDNKSGELLPGMVAEMSFSGSTSIEGIEIPAGAVALGIDNNYFVWTVENGRAKKKSVEVAYGESGKIVATEGLAENDTIIVEGSQKIGQGTSVTIDAKAQ